MTNATSAPVIIPSMATPNRISNQLMTRPPGEVTNAASPWPRTVAIPQLNESKIDSSVHGFSSSVISDGGDRHEHHDPLGQRQEEAPVELAAHATDVPRDAADQRAGEGRQGELGHRAPILPSPACPSASVRPARLLVRRLARREEPALDRMERPERDDHDDRCRDGHAPGRGAGGHADGGHRPQARGGRQAADGAAAT